jgi:PBP1b-binding outer membrane lipoprotein LpoB
MKKLTIIAAIACSTLFFTSCEQDTILPQNAESQGNSVISDFSEREFRVINTNSENTTNTQNSVPSIEKEITTKYTRSNN